MLLFRPVQFTVDSSKADASYLLSREITSLIKNCMNKDMTPVILCIGTDRSTGDCLGPLVGDKLKKNYLMKNIQVYGTLNEPVHAKNLDDNIDKIYREILNPFIIAIDASLGKTENVGKINIFKGPLYPGAGVNKNLKPVGDISITGIVNISGFMEYIVLQNTRLSLVMQMADVISLGLYMSLRKLKGTLTYVY
ncbi:spore protease YyaC [Fonticella tunisiensis]|uniref:Putative sporulation protein YyaC n=1 Tax=Fonticella tunisiensis TaxID=1096341 RepID=A0A4R7KA17_9CLOT|nr:spore protease YyaC [Fonticella tunisiensis]TDT50483.1 putative sporulation protein YyaC [Fonticella tunisiensis]